MVLFAAGQPRFLYIFASLSSGSLIRACCGSRGRGESPLGGVLGPFEQLVPHDMGRCGVVVSDARFKLGKPMLQRMLQYCPPAMYLVC